MKLKVNVPCIEYFQKKQAEPSLHVCFKNCNVEHQIYVFVLDWGHFSTVLDVPFAASEPLPDNAVVLFDLYVKTQNSEGVWCRMHRASSNLFLKDAQVKLGEAQTKIKATLANNWVGSTVGSIQIELMDVLPLSFQKKERLFFEDAAKANAMTKRFTDLIHGEMGLFNGQWEIRSRNKFIKRVHAPYFQGRLMTMPGFAYCMNSQKFRGTSLWYLHWFTNALLRLGLTDSVVDNTVKRQFKLQSRQLVEGFHHITLLLATMISSSVTCYPYECDFYVENGVQKPFESFDNVFVRKAGDCEDFGRGMHMVFSTFTVLKIPPTSIYIGLRALQKVAKLYLTGIVLGSVSQNSHGASIMKTRQAHMYIKLFPVNQFTERIKVPAHHAMNCKHVPTTSGCLPWMDQLRVYTVEGTAPVQPFTSLETMQSDLDSKKQQFELRSARLQNIPHGMVREFRPIWGVFEDPFYKTDCHVYTDYFLTRGFGMGSFALYDTQCSSYGVPMQSVLDMQHTAFLPHQIITQEDLKAIECMLEYEHPMPIMSASCTTGRTWSVSGDKDLDKQISIFVQRLETAESVVKQTDLYNDFFIQTPQQLTQQQMDHIVSYLENHTQHREVFVEGVHPEEMILRVRAYGLTMQEC